MSAYIVLFEHSTFFYQWHVTDTIMSLHRQLSITIVITYSLTDHSQAQLHFSFSF